MAAKKTMVTPDVIEAQSNRSMVGEKILNDCNNHQRCTHWAPENMTLLVLGIVAAGAVAVAEDGNAIVVDFVGDAEAD